MGLSQTIDRTRSAVVTGSRATVAKPAVAVLPLALASVAVAVLHIVCISQYGYFRDELYYLACAKHLAWGYVDHPPLCVGLLRLVTDFFGDSLVAVRSIGVVAGFLSVWVAGLVAREHGGKAWAQGMAGLAVAAAPTVLVVTHLYSMNGVDVLLWALTALVFAKLTKKPSPALWLLLGGLLGLGLLNKLSVLWLMAGLAVAVVATDRRKDLRSPWPWAALVTALLVASPFIIWQVQNGFPTLEFARNANDTKLTPIEPWMFLAREVFVFNPLAVPFWVVGAVVGLREPKWRGTTLVFLTVLAVLLLNGRSRENYLTPAYVFVLAPGVVAVERWLAKRPGLAKAYSGAYAATLPAMAVLTLPLLPVQKLAEVYALKPVATPASEKSGQSPIYGFADMFGWRNMARAVEATWGSLPEADRRRAVVIAANYGEAAAVQRFATGSVRDRVVGRHNNYWMWGTKDWDGQTAVVVGDMPPTLLAQFKSVALVGRLDERLAVTEEAHAPIYIVRGLKSSVPDFWAQARLFR
ncbi:MAG: glycosyltransferase family 39 protein [Fimbriimonadaceae bacterium]|nr:glycosyltransferase family 39 protein [Fimbriimonadaceae bacterium]